MAIFSDWFSLSRQQKMILIACLALFIPFYYTSLIHLSLLIYAFIKKDLQEATKEIKGAKSIIFFSLYSFLVSLFYKNSLGMLCSAAIFILFEMIVFYQKYADQALFKKILHLFIFMSIFCGIYGLMEYNGILDTIGIDSFKIVVLDNPSVRLNSVFFNANYYAMMLEFFVLMAFYVLMSETNNYLRCYYILVILFNLFMLYLSGCRTAWPALVMGIFMLTLYKKDKRWLLGFLGFCCLMMIFFVFLPDVFPRLDNIEEYFLGRVNIWKVSIDYIKTHFLFGNGPLTYHLIYPRYENAICTQHAHNIFIDVILSYGIVGVGLISPYFKARYQEFKQCKKTSLTYSIITAFLMTTIVHGLLDYTVYFIPTGFTFLMILSSSTIEKKQESI